jgi:hypothetical protein
MPPAGTRFIAIITSRETTMGTVRLQDLQTGPERQTKIDASVAQGIALINCGGSVQDAFDDLHKTISEWAEVPVAVRQDAVAKIHNAKINKDRIDAENASRAVTVTEIEALLSHRKKIRIRT